MNGKVLIVTWLVVFLIYCSFIWAAPVESEKAKDEFVFLLPATGNGESIIPGLSVNLEPPVQAYGTYRNARDSYGNPVPSYTAQDVESGIDKKVQTAQGLKFEIPSYASGITEIRKPTNELLPPLVSGEVPPNALQTPEVIRPPIELLPPLKKDVVLPGKQDVVTNEITERFADGTTIKPESEDIKDNDKTQKAQQQENKDVVGKYTGGFGGPPGILGEQKEKGYAIKELEEREKQEREKQEHEKETGITTEKHDDKNEEHTEAPKPVTSQAQEKSPETTVATTPLSSAFNSVLSSTFSIFDQNSQTTESSLPNEEMTEESHETERGLNKHVLEVSLSTSSPEIPTTDIPATQQPVVSLNSATTTPPSLPFSSPSHLQIVPIFSSQPGQQPSLPPFISPLSFGSPSLQQPFFGFQTPPFSPQSFQQTALPQTPEDSQQQPIPSIATPVVQQPVLTYNLEKFPPFDSLVPTAPSLSGRIDASGSPLEAPSPPAKLLTPPPKSISNTFGFSSVPISAPQPNPLIPSFGSTTKSTSNKYSGGFGGAPGILGNQAKPGYAIQPDGSIKDPDHAYKPPSSKPPGFAVTTATTTTTTTTQAPIIVTPVKYEKYTGGFGGPPGILLPYDNKHM